MGSHLANTPGADIVCVCVCVVSSVGCAYEGISVWKCGKKKGDILTGKH